MSLQQSRSIVFGPSASLLVIVVTACLSAVERVDAGAPESNNTKASSGGATKPFTLVCEKSALFKGHNGTICSLTYSPDGKTLAAGDSTGVLKLWSTGPGEEPVDVTLDNSGSVRSLAFSPDGKTLVAGSIWKGKPLVSICDVAKNKEVDQLQGPDHWVHHVAISPDGKWLAAAGGPGDTGAASDRYSVVIWNLDPRTEGAELAGHPGRRGIGGLAFAPDSKTLAVSCGDGSVKLWDLATRKESATVAKAGSGGLVFAPDGKTLFAGADNEITLTDVSKGEIRARWKFAATDVRVLAFSKDGALLVVAGYEHLAAGHVPVIQIWDAARGKELADLGDFRFNWLALSADGTSLAAGGNRMTIQVWKLERKPAEAGPEPEEYVFVKDTDRKVILVQGRTDSIGKLDEAGNFIPFKADLQRKRGQPVFGGGAILLNGAAQKGIYEYRSGRLIPGEIDDDGNFVPIAGEKIIDFKDYRYEPKGPKIYNLPGKFVRKGEKEEKK